MYSKFKILEIAAKNHLELTDTFNLNLNLSNVMQKPLPVCEKRLIFHKKRIYLYSISIYLSYVPYISTSCAIGAKLAENKSFFTSQ